MGQNNISWYCGVRKMPHTSPVCQGLISLHHNHKMDAIAAQASWDVAQGPSPLSRCSGSLGGGGWLTLLSSRSALCLSSLLDFSDFCSFCFSSLSSSYKTNTHASAAWGGPLGPLLSGEVSGDKASGTGSNSASSSRKGYTDAPAVRVC